MTATSKDPRQQICRTLDEPIAPRPATEFRRGNLGRVLEIVEEHSIGEMSEWLKEHAWK